MFKSHLKTHSWMLAALAAIVTFAVYTPALKNGFVGWDDWAYVYRNDVINTLDARFVWTVFTRPMVSNWHPLTMIAYAVDHLLWGLDPWGYHLSSVLVHSLDAALVVLIAIRLALVVLKDDRDAWKKALYIGVVSGLLFGLHPLHVESVAWVSEMKDVLSCLFFLLSLHAYLSYNEAASSSKARAYYASSLVVFSLALMSKPMAITLPFVLLMLDYYPLGRFSRGNGRAARVLVEKVPFLALSSISGLLTIWAQGESIISVDAVPLAERIFIASRAVIFYSYKMLLPLNLGPYYPLLPKGGLFTFEYAGSLALFIAITAFSLFSLRTRLRLLGITWLYFVVTLSPVLGIVQTGTQAAADRYTYIPSIAPFILAGSMVVWATARLEAKRALLARVAVLVLAVGAMAPLTMSQIKVWKDDVSLWTPEIDIYPQRAYTMLALAYHNRGDLEREITNYTLAIGYGGEELSELYLNRGAAYKMAGNEARAMQDYASAIEADPSNGKAYNNMANSLKEAGQYAGAIENYRKAAVLIPGNPAIYYNMALTYYQAGDVGKALESMEKAASLGLKEAEVALAKWKE